jgi:hypothetical protein
MESILKPVISTELTFAPRGSHAGMSLADRNAEGLSPFQSDQGG